MSLPLCWTPLGGWIWGDMAERVVLKIFVTGFSMATKKAIISCAFSWILSIVIASKGRFESIYLNQRIYVQLTFAMIIRLLSRQRQKHTYSHRKTAHTHTHYTVIQTQKSMEGSGCLTKRFKQFEKQPLLWQKNLEKVKTILFDVPRVAETNSSTIRRWHMMPAHIVIVSPSLFRNRRRSLMIAGRFVAMIAKWTGIGHLCRDSSHRSVYQVWTMIVGVNASGGSGGVSTVKSPSIAATDKDRS